MTEMPELEKIERAMQTRLSELDVSHPGYFADCERIRATEEVLSTASLFGEKPSQTLQNSAIHSLTSERILRIWLIRQSELEAKLEQMRRQFLGLFVLLAVVLAVLWNSAKS